MSERFYVYALRHGEQVCYVGKGSGNRFEQQKRAYGLDGEIIERFSSEAKAYTSERKHIEKLRPYLNRCVGGNGPRCQRRPRMDSWTRNFERIGSREYTLRLLAACELAAPGIVLNIHEKAA